jgi:hypothetical protein
VLGERNEMKRLYVNSIPQDGVTYQTCFPHTIIEHIRLRLSAVLIGLGRRLQPKNSTIKFNTSAGAASDLRETRYEN